MAEYSLSELLENKNIFIVKRSSIGERFDPKYHIVKKELLSEFKYPLEKIGNSFIVKDGDHDKLPSEAIRRDNQGKRYLRAQDLKDNQIINDNPIYITDDYFNKITRCHIYPGDLLVSIMASLGATAIVPDDYPVCTANRAIGILRQKENGKLLPEYVQVLMNTNLGFALFEVEKKGGIQQRLNLSDITNVQLPTPKKEIQQEIVNRYHEALNNKQQKEKEAQDLLNGIDDYLLKALGIKIPKDYNKILPKTFITNFKEITGNRIDPDYTSKYNFIISQKSKYAFSQLKDFLKLPPQYGANEEAVELESDEDIRYIRITDIDELGYLKKDGSKTAKRTDARYLLNEDDLLFARSGSVGKCYIHKNVTSKCIFAGYLIRFVVDEKVINPDYVFYYCNSSLYKLWVSAIERPAVQSNINSQEYKSLPIPVPPLDLQIKISTHIKTIRDNALEIRQNAQLILEEAKAEIEKIILG